MKLEVISHKQFNKTKHNLEKLLNVSDIQSYFPTICNYNLKKLSDKSLFKSRYLFKHLMNEVVIINNSRYMKTVFEATIFDRIKKTNYYENVFIKSIPILDPIGVSIGIFSLNNTYLSNFICKNTQTQINNYNNEAYIDAFFTYIGSYMGEQNIAPTFPRFFGTYSCITKKFRYDVTEELLDIKQYTRFNQNCNKLFVLEHIADNYIETTSSSLQSIMSHNSINSCDLHSEFNDSENDNNSEHSDIIDMFSIDKLELGDIDKELQNNEHSSFLLFDNFPTYLKQ